MSFPPSSGWHAKIIIVRANTFCLMKNEGGASPHLARPLCLLPLPPILPQAFSVSLKEETPNKSPFPFCWCSPSGKQVWKGLTNHGIWAELECQHYPELFPGVLLASSPVPSQIFHSCPQDLTFRPLPCAQELALPTTAQKLPLGGHQGKVPSTSCSPAYTLCIPVYWYLSTDLLVYLQILDICPPFRKRQRTKDIFYLCVQ